jgi:uncharacterized protein
MKGKKFYILSIDGGGLKGLIAVKILRIIEDITGENISGKFDLLAGTSTGGLIVAALATGDHRQKPRYDLQHIENMYVEVGQSVFMHGGLTYSGKEGAKMDALLQETFGETMLSQTIRPLFIPTYDITRGRIIGFKTRSALKNKLKDLPLKTVCKATSAIPPVFSSCAVNYNGQKVECIDAGMYLKNPALSALAEVFKHRGYYGPVSEEDIVLLSISTGTQVAGKNDWTTEIEDILYSQQSDMDYITQQSLKIDFKKIKFMRVDLKLGGSPFSLSQLLEWMDKLATLSSNKLFKKEILALLEEK